MIIDIGSVLMKFDDTYNDETLQVKNYGIRFITGDGRVRTMQCRKNVRSPRQIVRTQNLASPQDTQLFNSGGHASPQDTRSIQARTRRKGMFNLQRHGTMLVHDMHLGEPRTVKVSQIFAFCDFNSTNWLTVKH